MVEWVKKFLFDETAFKRAARALLVGGSVAWMGYRINGYLDTEMILAAIGLGAGGFIGVGEPNKEREPA